MSKIDITTHDLFMRLGGTSQLRRARADAVFRRLRIEQRDQIADALARGARLVDASALEVSDNGDDARDTRLARKALKTAR